MSWTCKMRGREQSSAAASDWGWWVGSHRKRGAQGTWRDAPVLYPDVDWLPNSMYLSKHKDLFAKKKKRILLLFCNVKC